MESGDRTRVSTLSDAVHGAKVFAWPLTSSDASLRQDTTFLAILLTPSSTSSRVPAPVVSSRRPEHSTHRWWLLEFAKNSPEAPSLRNLLIRSGVP
ncbi:hypothetical protein HPB52_004505 [Rhipicephalus sanguineus]|uniref:Uncharacterized protein n=1 Tax=Rhipicephalus sanguineus TaxID=34632 RepID=A0A9D4Q4T2_RHISA|nr:hypothetical protein HPB52_004505 [Rhipicephalus sanguineus]